MIAVIVVLIALVALIQTCGDGWRGQSITAEQETSPANPKRLNSRRRQPSPRYWVKVESIGPAAYWAKATRTVSRVNIARL